MINSKSNKNHKVISPSEISDLISDLAIKYELENENAEEELLEKMAQVESFKEKEKIFESSPGRQIAKTIKETAQDKIKDKDMLITALQERLNIPKETAQELAKDLEKKILSLIQITLKEKETSSFEKIEEEKKETSSPLEEKKKTTEDISPKESSSSKKKDIYRELIE